MRVFWVFLGLVGVVWPVFGTEALTPDPLGVKVVLTHKEGGLVPQKKLVCEGKLHAYLTFSRAVTTGTLEGVWMIPDGTEVERTRVELDFPHPGARTAYLWLAFDDGGGLLGALSDEPEPEQRFHGKWALDVRLNEKSLGQTAFQMDCY